MAAGAHSARRSRRLSGSHLAATALTPAGPSRPTRARSFMTMWLGREVGRRQARMMMELPTLTDLLCLAVTAGESPRAALERVVRVADGEMRGELAVVVATVRGGTPLATALEELAARVPLPQVARFVDAPVVAMERGSIGLLRCAVGCSGAPGYSWQPLTSAGQ